MNRDFLKEAIADAKAVKESAIANAKAALEESFTPHLKSVLSAKLQEMDDKMEEDDVKEEMKAEKNDKISEEAMDDKKKMSEEMKDKDKMSEEMKDKEKMEEVDLDEVLAEIEEAEDVTEEMKDKEKMDEAEEDEGETEEGEVEETEAEEVDLDDMTDEDLKAFIEDVIEDMVNAGEIEAGENFEDDVDVTVDDDGSIEVETEDEAEVTESTNNVNESEEVSEVLGAAAGIAGLFAAAGGLAKIQMAMENPETAAKYPKLKTMLDVFGELGAGAGQAMRREANMEAASDEDLDKIENMVDKVFETKSAYGEDDMKKEAMRDSFEEDSMKEDLDEAYATIETLRSDLNEINLLNAKLLYTNKIFKSKNLNENDKVKVLENFDKATTVKEAKLIYETLKDLKPKGKKRSIKENLGRASKSSGIAPKKTNPQPIVESNQMVDRFKKLAGII